MSSALLLDLDGTLADTAEDLRLALNQLLTDEGLATVAANDIRNLISKGSTAMLKVGLTFEEGSARHQELRRRLFDYYIYSDHKHTELFPGMGSVLHTLEQANIPWGIVTNKFSELAIPVIEKLQLVDRMQCLVCADTTGKAKPHPEPLLHAAKLINMEPQHCLYVGDAHSDSIAAESAGMPFIAAAYGYLPSEPKLSDWQTHGIIDQPTDLLAYLPVQQ